MRCDTTLRRCWARVLASVGLAWVAAGCEGGGQAGLAGLSDAERHLHRQFGEAELPRHIGTITSIDLQAPRVSPDLRQTLYLRTDRGRVNPMTLLGSTRPAHTPEKGMLAIWLRSTNGTELGRRLSPERWAHSPVWSHSGRAVAYVVNEERKGRIVHIDLATGRRTAMGLANRIHAMPRFDHDDMALLFCVAPAVDRPFRVYRQRPDDARATPLTPEDDDCVLPVRTFHGDGVLCARAEGEKLRWVIYARNNAEPIDEIWGMSTRPGLLQAWAGIAQPLSADGKRVLFRDSAAGRVRLLDVERKAASDLPAGSRSACWLGDESVAVATPDLLSVWTTDAEASLGVAGGQWMPCRYDRGKHRLIMLGAASPGQLAIWDVIFTP